MHFYILIRSWNAFPYLEKCLQSVLAQESDNYTVLFVDDCSDYTKAQKKWIQSMLKEHACVFNQERKFSVRNAYEMIHAYAEKRNSIVVNVDGDDWLNGENVLQVIEETYVKDEKCVLTYGDCYYFDPGNEKHLQQASKTSKFVNHRYPPEVEIKKKYRSVPFLPLHLRTWKTAAFKKISQSQFKRPDGSWLKFCEDQAIFYPILEMSDGNYQVIQQPLYFYNRENSRNDNKVHLRECFLDELSIRHFKNN